MSYVLQSKGGNVRFLGEGLSEENVRECPDPLSLAQLFEVNPLNLGLTYAI